MGAWIVLILIPIELTVAVVVVKALLGNAWRPIEQAFPEKPKMEPNFQRYYQSLSFGIVNAGFSYHITIDDEYLHLAPVRPLCWLGLRTASIPWGEIQFHKKQPMSKRFARVVIAKQDVVAPAWCFEMLKLNETN